MEGDSSGSSGGLWMLWALRSGLTHYFRVLTGEKGHSACRLASTAWPPCFLVWGCWRGLRSVVLLGIGEINVVCCTGGWITAAHCPGGKSVTAALCSQEINPLLALHHPHFFVAAWSLLFSAAGFPSPSQMFELNLTVLRTVHCLSLLTHVLLANWRGAVS